MIRIIPYKLEDSWEYGGDVCYLRISANQRFTSGGVTVLKGNNRSTWFREITCRVEGRDIQIPEIYLPSTTDSSDPTATYTAIFLNSRRKTVRQNFFQRWRVSADLGEETTWDLIDEENRAAPSALPSTYWTSGQVLQAINDFFEGVVLQAATRLLRGTVAITADALDATFPIAVSATDDVYTSALTKKYLRGYASLAAAITAIGSTPTELVVDSNVALAANTTTPANILIKPEGNALFTVASGFSLTIGAMSNVGNKKIFAGDGNVYFAKNAVPYLKLFWWTGTDDSLPVTKALNNICQSLNLMGGGRAYIHNGNWTTAGNHVVYSSSYFIGEAATLQEAAEDTEIKLTSNNSCIFKIGASPAQNSRTITFERLKLTCLNTTGSRAILATDNQGSAVVGVICRGVIFYGGWRGFALESLSGAWNLEGVRLENCGWLGGIEQGVFCDSNNSSIQISQPFMQIAAGCVGVYLQNAGMVHITGAGNAVSPPGFHPGFSSNNRPHPNFEDSTFVEIRGDNLPITIEKIQEEGLGWFVRCFAQQGYGSLTLRENLIQSMILTNGSWNIKCEGNDFRVAECFVTDQSASATALNRVKSSYDTCGVFAGAFTVNGIEVRDSIQGVTSGALAGTTSLPLTNLRTPQNYPQNLLRRHIAKTATFTVAGVTYTRVINNINGDGVALSDHAGSISFFDPLTVSVPNGTVIYLEPLNSGCLMDGYLPLGEGITGIPNYSYFTEYDRLDRYRRSTQEVQRFEPSSHLSTSGATPRVFIGELEGATLMELALIHPYTKKVQQSYKVTRGTIDGLLRFDNPEGIYPFKGIGTDGILKSNGLQLAASTLMKSLTFGQAILGADGTVTIPNITAQNNSVILCNGFGGGFTGRIEPVAITNKQDFTLASSAGAADAGKLVMWAVLTPPG